MRSIKILAGAATAALALTVPAPWASATSVDSSATAATSGRSLAHPMKTPRQVQTEASQGLPPLLYHGGPVMRNDVNYTIFWKPAKLQDGSTVTGGGTAYQSLINRWFADAGQTGVFATTKQYGASQGSFPTTTSFGASYIDTTPFPVGHCTTADTGANCITDADIRAEVKKIATAHGFGNSNGRVLYVYTPQNEGSCFDSFCSSQSYRDYCAYHSPIVSGNNAILYTSMPFPTVRTGNNCYYPPGGPQTFPNGNVNADAVISVTSHEQFESITDPLVNFRSAWYDAAGFENGDECAWQFGPNVYAGGGDVIGNGHVYEVQQEYSNAQADCAVVGP